MANPKLPPASAYEDGPSATEKRYRDLKRIQEGLAPIHARTVTEAGAVAPAAGEPAANVEVTLKDLAEMRVDNPEAYRELQRAYANSIFAGHDSRRGGGHSPFNKGVGA